MEENPLKASTIATVLKGSYYILKMSGSLLSAWLTLGWRVGRARRSFEKQLVKGGMTREDARQVSEVYSELKDQMMSTVKGAISSARKSGNNHFPFPNAASA